MQLKFKAVPRLTGSVVRITVPRAYVRSYGITLGKEYDFTIEVTDDEK